MLKLVNGVLLERLVLADPGPGLSLRGLNTESLESLLDSENLLASNVGS